MRHREVLDVGTTVTLDASIVRGLAYREVNVREAFTLVDAGGTSFRASLKSLEQGSGTAEVYERIVGDTESPVAITLVCAVLGRQRMIPVVQKATELGCVRVVPVLSDHSVKPVELAKEKPWAWEGQAIKASRQCRRASVPEVMKTQSLGEAMKAPWFRDAGARLFLDDRSESAADPLVGLQQAKALVLVVGPEGGFSDGERQRMKAAGATVLRFGSRVLRAETAALAGLAVLQHRLGDLR
ncbi:MAG: 16S rRNA (uracil(1498)-N(3))-methyltransferase [Polyangiaceae bacterium]|nr:16S rRNA (uracil(1498)-N(3))-methyltransferase [Polyangiaceae bacterium]